MRWIVGFTFLIFIMGGVAALGWTNTDLLNPITSKAITDRMKIEDRHLDVMNQLEEQLAAAQTEAEIARIRHEQELEEARYQTELARIAADQAHHNKMLLIAENTFQAFMNVLVVGVGTAIMASIFVGTKFALSRTVPARTLPPAPANQSTYRYSPNGYNQARINARQRELLERAIMLRLTRNASKTKQADEYQNLPLAGD
ncbi:MAG: hypothetical protein ACK4VW_10045 [Anaerolineales bacterium]